MTLILSGIPGLSARGDGSYLYTFKVEDTNSSYCGSHTLQYQVPNKYSIGERFGSFGETFSRNNRRLNTEALMPLALLSNVKMFRNWLYPVFLYICVLVIQILALWVKKGDGKK